MVTSATGDLRPSSEDLVEIAIDQHRRGRQLAFHAVEAEAVIAAAHAIASTGRFNGRPDPRHRIEHCAEAPPEILRLVKDSGATVVTQPGFVYHHGAKYLANVEPGLINHLYPLAGLADSGIPWAASSDAPVSPIESPTTRPGGCHSTDVERTQYRPKPGGFRRSSPSSVDYRCGSLLLSGGAARFHKAGQVRRLCPVDRRPYSDAGGGDRQGRGGDDYSRRAGRLGRVNCRFSVASS